MPVAVEVGWPVRRPEIFNSDQGSQFTNEVFTQVFTEAGIAISMDGVGRAFDARLVERLWRTVKHKEVYLRDYQTPAEGLTVGPVFGQIKATRGLDHFCRRGETACGSEWSVICTTHNLLKLFRSGKAAWNRTDGRENFPHAGIGLTGNWLDPPPRNPKALGWHAPTGFGAAFIVNRWPVEGTVQQAHLT